MKLCKNNDGRTVIHNTDICGPCFAQAALASWRYTTRYSPHRRGVCKHCGKTRNLNGRDLCLAKCARLGLDYPVIARPGRKRGIR